jgi:hypothetical protein
MIRLSLDRVFPALAMTLAKGSKTLLLWVPIKGKKMLQIAIQAI